MSVSNLHLEEVTFGLSVDFSILETALRYNAAKPPAFVL